MTIATRQDRAAFRFFGPDAAKLLGDVLTARFDPEPGYAAWWALLSPQGKVQAEGLSGWHDGAFYLDTHANCADDFFKRMRMYKLRADLEITDLRATHAVGFSAEPLSAHTDEIVTPDARHQKLGCRIIAPSDLNAGWQAEAGYAAARLSLGIAEIGTDYPADTLFPHDMGMDLLSGVDFSKGCYVGQEVVSRMQHRGTARRRPIIVRGDGLETGATIRCGEKDIGTLGQVAHGTAVAIVRLDRIRDRDACTVGDTPVSLALPEWARYDFPDSAPMPETQDSD